MTTTEMTRPTIGTAPERSHGQRRDALKLANEVRSYRSQLKRELKAGGVRGRGLADLLIEPPQQLLTMKLWDLLMALPNIGRVKTNQIIVRHKISPSKTIGGLSERQRGVIVAEIW